MRTTVRRHNQTVRIGYLIDSDSAFTTQKFFSGAAGQSDADKTATGK